MPAIAEPLRLTLGVVITNYNTWDQTMFSVQQHLRFAGPALTKIIIVDDHSNQIGNNSLDRKVELIRNPENLGFVKSANIGFHRQNADIILLFDSDAYPIMDYSNIVGREFQNDPDLAILGFTTYSSEGKISGSSESEPDALGLILGQRLHAWFRQLFPREGPLVVYSCAMAVRKTAFDQIEGFDEHFDWLDLDHDLCMRLRKEGWRIKKSLELHAVHEGGGTPQNASARSLRFYRNRWYLLLKHHKIRQKFLIKHLILGRLCFEFVFLKLFGSFLFKEPEERADKLNGRKTIIRYCLTHYV